MTIETKYNIGEYVYALLNGKIASFIVSQISIVRTEHNTYTTYGLRTKNEPIITINTTERFMFPTKEELLKSL
jgi:hypothetical protein